MPTSSSASAAARVSATVSASPGQPGALGSYPFSRNSSSHGAHADEWIQSPWMKTTGVSDMFAPSVGVARWSELLGEAAVDEEVGPGHVACSAAGQEQDEVGDLLRL